MKKNKLKKYIEILKENNLLLEENVSNNLKEQEIDIVTYDSREVKQNTLFICKGIDDPEVVQKAKRNELIGFSFGFEDRDIDEHSENGMMTRDVNDLDLYEVSVLDRTKTPAYDGTLINVRDSEGEQAKKIYFGETFADEINIKDDSPEKRELTEDAKPIDYSEAEKIISEMKGEN